MPRDGSKQQKHKQTEKPLASSMLWTSRLSAAGCGVKLYNAEILKVQLTPLHQAESSSRRSLRGTAVAQPQVT